MAKQQAVADDRAQESPRRAVHVVHRRERLERRAEHGPHLHPAQAARAAAARRAGDRPAARPQLSSVPGIRVYPQVLPTIRIGGQLTKALYQYTLQDTDLQELYQWAPDARTIGCGSCPACRT